MKNAVVVDANDVKNIEMSKAESMDSVTRLKNHGYIICHIIGDWYLVRRLKRIPKD